MIEVELKAALTPAQYRVLFERLPALGFSLECEYEHRDRYYNGADRDFRTTDEALRVRIQTDGTGFTKGHITYKGPKQDVRSSTRRELETQVGDPETAMALFESLGCPFVLDVKKQRSSFHNAGVTACLDHVDRLGHFLELEQVIEQQVGHDDTVSELLEWLDRLGIPHTALERRSYLELLIQHGKL